MLGKPGLDDPYLSVVYVDDDPDHCHVTNYLGSITLELVVEHNTCTVTYAVKGVTKHIMENHISTVIVFHEHLNPSLL